MWLTGCGAGSSVSSPAPTSASPLAGNWLLFGSLPRVVESSSNPDGMALSIDVSGKTILATAALSMQCGSVGPSFGARFGAVIVGALADDGTFSLSAPVLGNVPGSITLSITGKAPTAAASSWSGNYSITIAGSVCAAALSGPFTATAVRDLTGKFAGSGDVRSFLGSTTPVTMTLSLQQGAPLLSNSNPALPNSRLGLQGQVQVQGLSCFSKGSTTTASEVQGGPFLLTFTMDDGSTMSLLGSIADAATSSLNVEVFNITGGSCAGIYSLASTPLVVKLQP